MLPFHFRKKNNITQNLRGCLAVHFDDCDNPLQEEVHNLTIKANTSMKSVEAACDNSGTKISKLTFRKVLEDKSPLWKATVTLALEFWWCLPWGFKNQGRSSCILPLQNKYISREWFYENTLDKVTSALEKMLLDTTNQCSVASKSV